MVTLAALMSWAETMQSQGYGKDPSSPGAWQLIKASAPTLRIKRNGSAVRLLRPGTLHTGELLWQTTHGKNACMVMICCGQIYSTPACAWHSNMIAENCARVQRTFKAAAGLAGDMRKGGLRDEGGLKGACLL